jgi:uncharacterized Zn-finger protein
MGLKTSNAVGWFTYVVLGVWVISGIIVTFSELQIDSIVHVQLYNHGLQFSTEWANPYWTAAKTVYASLALPIILTVIVFGLKLVESRKNPEGFLARRAQTSVIGREAVSAQTKLQIGTVVEENELLSVNFPPEHDQPKEAKAKSDLQASNGLLISCPSCTKVFNRPLVMLDFSGGKTQLVNLCPYCNYNLGSTVEQRKSRTNCGPESQQ